MRCALRGTGKTIDGASPHSEEILVSILTAWSGLVLLIPGCGHACGYPLLFATLLNGAVAAIALLVCTVLFMRASAVSTPRRLQSRDAGNTQSQRAHRQLRMHADDRARLR